MMFIAEQCIQTKIPGFLSLGIIVSIQRAKHSNGGFSVNCNIGILPMAVFRHILYALLVDLALLFTLKLLVGLK